MYIFHQSYHDFSWNMFVLISKCPVFLSVFFSLSLGLCGCICVSLFIWLSDHLSAHRIWPQLRIWLVTHVCLGWFMEHTSQQPCCRWCTFELVYPSWLWLVCIWVCLTILIVVVVYLCSSTNPGCGCVPGRCWGCLMDQLLRHLPCELWAAKVAVGGCLLVDGPLQVKLPARHTHNGVWVYWCMTERPCSTGYDVWLSAKGCLFKPQCLQMAYLYQNT